MMEKSQCMENNTLCLHQIRAKIMVKLDLTKIKTVVINLDSQPERLVEMDKLLGSIGISYDRFSAVSNKTTTGTQTLEGFMCCAKSHHNVVSNLTVPTMVLEDDLCKTTFYGDDIPTVLEVPEEADAIYLGVSNWAYVHPVRQRGFHNQTVATRYCEGWKRVYNMLAAHAIIYLKEDFVKEVIKQQKQCIEEGVHWDLGMASIHRDFVVLTPDAPLFYQKDLPQYTNFILNPIG